MNDFILYLSLGFEHVVPLGYDHILFISTLFFLNSEIKSVVWQCTVFTLAHSLSLAMATLGWVMADPRVIEPLIALSILFTAIENLFHHKVNAYRLLVIFVFGLIHGLGFAGALKMLGVPKEGLVISLVSFNVGVELGQVGVVLILYGFVGKWFAQKPWYQKKLVVPFSIAVAIISLYWLFQRMLN